MPLSEPPLGLTPSTCSLAQLAEYLSWWHRARYGLHPVHLHATALKLQEEVGEVSRAMLKMRASSGTGADVVEELADTVMVCFHLARGIGKDLGAAILKKLHVNVKRLDDPNYGRPQPQATTRQHACGERCGE